MKKKIGWIIAIVMVLMVFIVLPVKAAGAEGDANPSVSPEPTPAPTSVVVRVDYTTGKLNVTAGTGNSTKLYFSTDKKKTWELIETGGTIDLRPLIKSSAVVLYFKGNKDQEPVEFIIPAENKDLKVAYQVSGGTGIIVYTGNNRPMEYRVGTDGDWVNVPTDAPISTTLYEITGATLQFRTKAIVADRAGKIVSLKIPKRPKAPSVKVDGSKLVLTGLKAGAVLYRLNSNTEWIPFNPADTKVKTLSLAEIILPPSAPDNARISSALIEVRSAATTKAPASAIKTIELDLQRPASTTPKLEGITLTITDASTQMPYEYIVLHGNEKVDLLTAKWKSVTTSKPQVIKKCGKADIMLGDVIYVRLKAVKNKTTGEESLASTYSAYTVTSLTDTTKTTPTPTPEVSPSVSPAA